MNFPSVQCEASAVARCRAHSNIVVRRVLFRRYGGDNVDCSRRLAQYLAILAATFIVTGPAQAQTKLKWAHVYEVAEPYHAEALWAADEIKKRTDGRYEIQVFPASAARQ